MEAIFRTGDVLRLSCPYTPALVTGTSGSDVFVRWPWWKADSECEWIRWNGDVALPRRPGSHDWGQELFRTDPAPDGLQPGDQCLVGIPPALVHITEVQHFDPPLETGRLPRPRTYVVVLPEGQSQDPRLDEQGYEIDPDDDIPIRVDLVFRPYSFLHAGDELVDQHERAWRFDAPWDWYAFDRGEPSTPAWPLTLLTRGGTFASNVAGAIAQATSASSHEEELARWKALTKAEPTRLHVTELE
ncbi:hypothetical protein FXF50_05430 [Micromonospora sp. AP08]|uniref:hypothetical protein n=1 Tax=Micromonospora sp. AP08 TaxID=2604467 RepID=UPI0011D5868B|nr:hypothetical protein [Micromonospora sp. AP08]TYB39809.1 hypothetical protein FXF50_05430 [Micromonospora sp. AP08]